ncbi:MAG: phosphatidate cytidylyltransferase [Candidatus Margulisiibacteriota bacterium]
MKRIITGIILLGIGYYVLSNGDMPLFVFLTTIGVLSFYEVRRITDLRSPWLMVSNMVFYTAIMAYIHFFNVTFSLVYMVPVIVLFFIFCFEFFRKTLVFRRRPFLNNLKYFCYIYFGFSSIYLIREFENGLIYICLLFLSIWATDVFAYYGGKTFGRTKLSDLSPKKTVEGTVAGVSAAVVLMGCVCYVYGFSYYFMVLALVIGLMGQMGDLYESLIKRTHQVKDSSNLLPGHGGILDRADSSLFVAPIVYLMILFFQ